MKRSFALYAFMASLFAAAFVDGTQLRGKSMRGKKPKDINGGRNRQLYPPYHSKKYYSKKHVKKYAKHYYSRDRLGMIWALPFVPIVFFMFPGFPALTADQCSCRGGALGGLGQDDLCDCICYCDEIDSDLVPVVLEEGVTYTEMPDFVNPDSDTCGCVDGVVFEPIVVEDIYYLTTGSSLDFNPVSNDIEVNGNSLEITDFTQPNGGSVVQKPDGSLTYTPNDDFIGTDTFEYTISNNDGGVTSGTATFIVSLGDDLFFSTPQDVALTIDANEFPIAGDDIEMIASPGNGSIEWEGDGSLLYVPNSNFVGPDSFQYGLTDTEGNTVMFGVTIIVEENGIDNVVPDFPDDSQPMENDKLITNQNTELNFGPMDLLANDNELDRLTFQVVNFAPPSLGTIKQNGDGTYAYIPFNNILGEDTFGYTLVDGGGVTYSGLLTIVINGQPIAVDDSFSVAKGNQLVITDQDLLSNDSDPDGDSLEIDSYTQPANGRVLPRVLRGGLTYTPIGGFTGIDHFEYIVTDGKDGFGAAKVTILVGAVLSIVNDNFTTKQNTELVVSAPGVFGNDEGVELKVIDYGQPSNGAVFVHESGTFTYIPNTDWKGLDSFTYKVIDVFGNTGQASVAITVESIVNSPNASPTILSTSAPTPSLAPGLCRRFTTDTETAQFGMFVVDCEELDDGHDGSINTDILLINKPNKSP